MSKPLIISLIAVFGMVLLVIVFLMINKNSEGFYNDDFSKNSYDQVDFENGIKEKTDIEVKESKQIDQPGMSVKGTEVILKEFDNASIQVYEYGSLESANKKVSEITPEGQFKTVSVLWNSDPHFFNRGKVIVIYVGEDEEVLELLGTIVSPFAGK
jgi:hypothetical protein